MDRYKEKYLGLLSRDVLEATQEEINVIMNSRIGVSPILFGFPRESQKNGRYRANLYWSSKRWVPEKLGDVGIEINDIIIQE